MRKGRLMTKKEKAVAIALHSAMKERSVSANMIMTFATTAEIHGYYKGLFLATYRKANAYTLIRKIEERKKSKGRGRQISAHTSPAVQLALF